jgi:hypothetical protein
MENFMNEVIAYNADNTVRNMFERVRTANIKLKPSKVEIGFGEVQFLSQVVSAGKVRPTDKNLEKILNDLIGQLKKMFVHYLE